MGFDGISLENQVRQFKRRVIFETTGVALSKGMGVCYNRDYGTAASVDGYRDKYVIKPDNTCNNNFAGVVAEDYSAKSYPQEIEIYEPGSVCQALTDAAATIGANTFVTCIAGGSDAGKWDITPGFPGRGTARVLQTTSAAGLCLVELCDGQESGLIETLVIAAAGGAVTPMIGGVTLIDGAAVVTAHATYTLLAGNIIGQRKRFKVVGADIGTSKNFVLTTTGLAVQMDGSTALATATFNAENEESLFEYVGGKWKLIYNAGTTLA